MRFLWLQIMESLNGEIMMNCLSRVEFMRIIMRCHDVGVKRYFDTFDTRLLRALHSRNPQKHE